MDLKTPDAKSLHSLPYSELKKLAKRKGIKSNMKAEKLIAALTAADSDDSESFLTPAAQVLNSCKKNKEAKFNVDKMTPLVTPRRGTYSLETPASVKAEDIPEITDEKASALDESNVTLERGSERKLRSRKVSFLSPVLTPQTPKNSSLKLRPKTPASFTSLCEQVSPSPVASARKNPNKNDSLCVEATPKQTLFPSGENDSGAPTPGTKRTSLKRKSTLNGGVPASGTKSISLKRKSSTLDDMEPGTESSTKKRKSSLYGGSTRSSVSQCDSAAKKKALATPSSSMKSAVDPPERSLKKVHSTTPSSSTKEAHLQPQQSLKKENVLTPRPTKSLGFVEDSTAKRKLLATPNVKLVSGTEMSSKKKLSTPGSSRSSVSRSDSAAKKKALATPNFKKIHARAFEKLESIDEYQKRMEESARKIKKVAPKVTRATTKIATFGGISFVPSVRPPASKPKLNISTNKNSGAAARSFLSQAETAAKKKSVATPTQIKSKTDAENSMKKKKFDLKASLSRKLGYKPYTGPLKPLAESNKLDTSVSCLHKPSENSIVKQKRLQNRTALKGVRTNKRFELQMKNRQLV